MKSRGENRGGVALPWRLRLDCCSNGGLQEVIRVWTNLEWDKQTVGRSRGRVGRWALSSQEATVWAPAGGSGEQRCWRIQTTGKLPLPGILLPSGLIPHSRFNSTAVGETGQVERVSSL